MRSLADWKLLAVVGALIACSPITAQDQPAGPSAPSPSQSPPTPLPTPPGLELTDPVPEQNRPGSPVQTLQRLTGQNTEPDRADGAERDEIETDRDSFTPATSTVGRGRFVVESAYSFLDNRGVKDTHSVPELITRYGITDRLELRLGWNYEVGGTGDQTSGSDAGNEDPARQSRLLREYTLSYGAKVRVTDQDGWLPRSIVILQGFTPTGGNTGATTATQLIATYAAGWLLPNKWRFDTAIRYGTDSEAGDRFSDWAPSAVLKIPLGKKWATHFEYFGTFTSGKAENSTEHYFSTGLHYLVTSNLEIGFRVGWGLNDQSARFFSNVGFGWRF